MEYAILAVVAAVVVYFAFFKKDDKPTTSAPSTPAPAPAPAPSAPVEQKKLPTATKLKAMTKAQLEELGRDFGVELDKRLTKDKMIGNLKSGVKAQLK